MMDWQQLLSTRRQGEQKAAGDQNRSQFEQDYDRIIFSQPFRRLQDKTQVFPLPEDDFVHTRLTHSLEVSSVGRSLGKLVGEQLIRKHRIANAQPQDFGAITGAASLAHDIGNPPFGHSGEDCISEFYINHPIGKQYRDLVSDSEWSDLTNFEGNAQGFRILNNEIYGGLKLTFATLGAFTKYPLGSSSQKTPDRKSQKKYGFYQGNLPLFEEIAGELGLTSIGSGKWARHPLVFLVEAADDICYHVIDLEDGCRLGLISLEEYVHLLKTIIGDRFSQEKTDKIKSFNAKLGALRALAINQLVYECSQEFLAREEQMLDGSFDQALTDCIPSKNSLEDIIKISIARIYSAKQVVEKEVGGYQVIESLLEHFTKAAINPKESSKNKTVSKLIPDEYAIQLRENREVYERLLLINDFVSGLTDSHAVKLYKTLNGISI